MVVFRGMMKNGVKEGECHEYDEEGKEIWYGMIKEGKRIPLLSEVKEKSGLYCEYNEEGCRGLRPCMFCGIEGSLRLRLGYLLALN